MTYHGVTNSPWLHVPADLAVAMRPRLPAAVAAIAAAVGESSEAGGEKFERDVRTAVQVVLDGLPAQPGRAGPVQIAQQQHLGPVVQGLPVDVQDQGRERPRRPRSFGRTAGLSQGLGVQTTDSLHPRGVLGVPAVWTSVPAAQARAA